MIDRYLIRYFLAVVDQGNFSRAAARCNVSQPTLSVGIAKLERALDRRLFSRTNQRVELTEAGSRFLSHARRIEHEFNTALRAMTATSHARPCRIGILNSIPGDLVARAVRDCSGLATESAEILFASEREMLGFLSRGRLDAALTIVRPEMADHKHHLIIDEGYAIVMPKLHRLAGQSIVDAEALRHETMIVRRHCEMLSQTSRYFVERGVRPHFSLRTTNDERALQMVGAGLGITVMPDCYHSPDVRHVRLEGFDHRRSLGFYFLDEAVIAQPLLVALAIELQRGAAAAR